MKPTPRAALRAATIPLCLATSLAAETTIDRVRAATERFTDVSVAIAEGYGPIPCASGASGGAMGIHYVHPDHLGGDGNTLDIAHPEAIMYEPQADGRLVLVGVEYITFAGPAEIDGHLLHHVGAPNRYGLDPFYELHVWAHRENPAGAFVDMNPDVSCDFAGARPRFINYGPR